MENNKGKAMVRDTGIYIFPVTVFDFEKALPRWQAPMLLPQGAAGSRYSPPEDVGG